MALRPIKALIEIVNAVKAGFSPAGDDFDNERQEIANGMQDVVDTLDYLGYWQPINTIHKDELCFLMGVNDAKMIMTIGTLKHLESSPVKIIGWAPIPEMPEEFKQYFPDKSICKHMH